MPCLVSRSPVIWTTAVLALLVTSTAFGLVIPDDVYKTEKSAETSKVERLRDPWSPEDPKANPSPDLPGRPATVTVPPDSLVDQGVLQAKELTPDGKIPAGQNIDVVTYEQCQFVKGSDKLLLETNGCEVYELLFNCETVRELWWIRPPRILMSRATAPGNEGYKRIVVCPEGPIRVLPGVRASGNSNSVYDVEPPVHAPELPPIIFPPMAEPAGPQPGVSAGAKAGPDPDTVDITEFYWKTATPLKIRECLLSYKQTLFMRVTRKNTRTGAVQIVSDQPANPGQERNIDTRVPCE